MKLQCMRNGKSSWGVDGPVVGGMVHRLFSLERGLHTHLTDISNAHLLLIPAVKLSITALLKLEVAMTCLGQWNIGRSDVCQF